MKWAAEMDRASHAAQLQAMRRCCAGELSPLSCGGPAQAMTRLPRTCELPVRLPEPAICKTAAANAQTMVGWDICHAL